MKVILSGYEGSKKILAASSYLANKYLPHDFDIYYLNYGTYDGLLVRGEYVSLAKSQDDGPAQWAKDIAKFLEKIDDQFVIFALDDYLLSGPLLMPEYKSILQMMRDNDRIACGRLCDSTFYNTEEYQMVTHNILKLTPQAKYAATTQYCIWDREYLHALLSNVSTPWKFELAGSTYLHDSKYQVIGLSVAALDYPDASCLSRNWGNKVRVIGNRLPDIEYLLSAGLLKKDELLYE